MKRTWKKALALLLALVFLVSLAPALSANAAAFEEPDKELSDIYNWVAFGSYVLGGQRYFDAETTVPDQQVYEYLKG